ncbi:hypothetical protein WJX75_005150 [Coccomyxa subellipsoidea]|uniref:Protein kinase domain-containing protein n=1 Tax=Coccomyxa subellipsoidea TaxID=248742 RepID=A0ABR2YRT0_9CHLO
MPAGRITNEGEEVQKVQADLDKTTIRIEQLEPQLEALHSDPTASDRGDLQQSILSLLKKKLLLLLRLPTAKGAQAPSLPRPSLQVPDQLSLRDYTRQFPPPPFQPPARFKNEKGSGTEGSVGVLWHRNVTSLLNTLVGHLASRRPGEPRWQAHTSFRASDLYEDSKKIASVLRHKQPASSRASMDVNLIDTRLGYKSELSIPPNPIELWNLDPGQQKTAIWENVVGVISKVARNAAPDGVKFVAFGNGNWTWLGHFYEPGHLEISPMLSITNDRPSLIQALQEAFNINMVTGELGSGASGTVFLVRLASGEKAALKAANCEDFGVARMLRLEGSVIRHLEPLQGKTIPRLLAAGPCLEGVIVVTEYIEGRHVDRSSPEHRALLPLARQKLRTIHSHRVLHGDLRADNIIITPANDVIFIDFWHALLRVDKEEEEEEQKDLAWVFGADI